MSPFFAPSPMPQPWTPLQATPSPPAHPHGAQLSDRTFTYRPFEAENDPLQLENFLPRVRRADAFVNPSPSSTPASAREGLSPVARADTLFVKTYSLIFSETPEQSKEKLREIDQKLYLSWNNVTDIRQISWKPRADRPATWLDIARAQSEFAIHLLNHPSLSDADAHRLSLDYMFQRPETVDAPSLEALYQGVLERGLHWVDLDAVRAKRISPMRILRMVCKHRGQPLAGPSLRARLFNYRDVIADEAALMHFHAQSACAGRPDCEIVARNAPMHAIRAQFATELVNEWQDLRIGAALLPWTPIAPAHAKFWFDGSSLQNAGGKRIPDIAGDIFMGSPYPEEAPIIQRLADQASAADDLPGYPDAGVIDDSRRDVLIQAMHGNIFAIFRYERRPWTAKLAGVYLTREETHALVAKRMRDLALGMHYPQCTVLDALEVTVRRLGPLHGIGLEAFHNPERLVKVYNELSRNWGEDPRFPIAPSPYAGQYLTRCRNALYLRNDSALTREQQIILQVAALFLPALVAALRPAPRSHLLGEAAYWSGAIRQLVEMRDTGPENFLARNLHAERQPLYNGVKACVDVRKDAAETIRYDNQTDLHHKLHAYMEAEMPTIMPLPKWDEEYQVGRILRRKLFLTDDEIHTPRLIGLGSGSSVGARLRSPDVFMTPYNEFRLRAERRNGLMTFGRITIDANQEWRHAQRTSAALFLENRVVRAKSDEMLRRYGIPKDSDDALRLRRSLADSLVGTATATTLDDFLGGLDMLFGSTTLRSVVEAVFSGEPKQILSLLPFIVPAYDVIEGISLRDWQRMKSGALHFVEDGVLTAVGLGAEKFMAAQLARDADAVLALRGRLASSGGAGVMQEMVEMRRASVVRPEVEIAETAFNGIADGAGDEAARTLPKEAATGIVPQRRAQLSLYLIDEKRWVPVKPLGDAFAETDLHGNVRDEAPIIYGDPISRRGYRLMRRRNALLPGAVADRPDPTQSATVLDVQAYHRRMSRISNIRARRPDPKKIIKALFSLADDAPSDGLRQTLRRIYTRYRTYAQFEEFWLRVYELSDTAVEFLNDAYDKLPFSGNAEINFGAEKAHVVGGDVYLVGARALEDMHYVSIEGATPFKWEQMLIHEGVHVFGRVGDTLVPRQRGATVYLTWRILFELGYAKPLSPRLAYDMPPVFIRNEASHRLWAEHLLDVHDMTIEEDRILDRLITKGRTVSSSAMVLGQKIGKRATVRQAIALAEYMRTVPKFGNGDVMRLSQFAAASFNSSAYSYFLTVLKNMIFKSKTARELVHAWTLRDRLARVKVHSIDFDLRDRWIKGPVTSHAIAENEIWINTEAIYYFSERGLTAMKPLRRHVGSIVDYILGEIMPKIPAMSPAERFNSRGLSVLLENEILEQMGDTGSPRICAESSVTPQDYHRHLTTVRRAADTETSYLRQTIATRLEALGEIAGEDDLLGLSAKPAPDR